MHMIYTMYVYSLTAQEKLELATWSTQMDNFELGEPWAKVFQPGL